VGLVAFGVIGLFSLIFTLRSTGFKIASVIIDLLAIALGVLLFMAEADRARNILLLGVAAVIGGVLLLLYGYYLWNKGRAVAA
jgi:membrane-bound ClpP family serine protease